MAQKFLALHPELPRPSDSADIVAAQVTDGAVSHNSKLSTKDLFDPCLFLTDENVIKRTVLDSPPRIGVCPPRRGYWMESRSENPLEWSLIFDFPKGSEPPSQKCALVKPVPSLPIVKSEAQSQPLPSLPTVQSEAQSQPVPSLPIVQSQTDKINSVGAGMSNLGNSCFMNSVFQCFLHSVPLVDGILSDEQGKCYTGEFCVLCAFRELISLSFTKFEPVSPWGFFNNLGEFSNSFTRHQQEDAHEFLQSFLNKLDNCYDENGKHSQSENLVEKVFRGSLISKLKCLACGYRSDSFEPSCDLSLEIENANDLIAAIRSFTKVEKIEDPDNNVDCQGCKKKEPAEKQLILDKVPSIATFHLKRFKNNGTIVEKIDKHVTFPLEMDLLPFTVNGETTDAQLKYMLHAVIVHQGQFFSSGHYYCCVKLAPNMWYRFSDENVGLVKEDEVLSMQAYILFYAKEGTPWFSSFIDTLSKKQVFLPPKETSGPLPTRRKIETSLDSGIGYLDEWMELLVPGYKSDCSDEAESKRGCSDEAESKPSCSDKAESKPGCSDEAESNPVCAIRLEKLPNLVQPSCKRSLDKLFDDEGSRKKSRSDDT